VAPRKRAAPAPVSSTGTLAARPSRLSNPAKELCEFLLRALLPTIIHVGDQLAAGYSVGSEFPTVATRGPGSKCRWRNPVVCAGPASSRAVLLFFSSMLARAASSWRGVLQIPSGGRAVDGRRRLLLIICLFVVGAFAGRSWSALADRDRIAGLFALLHSLRGPLAFLRRHEYLSAVWSAILPAALCIMAVLLGQRAAGIAGLGIRVPFRALAGLTTLLPVSIAAHGEPQAKGPV